MGAYFSFFGQSGRDNQQLTEMVGNAEFNNPNSRDEAMNDEDEMDAVADENNTMHDSGNEDEGEEVSELEYSVLDKQLDSLNSVLDVLEHKNDAIHEQLKALLQNSRDIRMNLTEETQQKEENDGK